MLGEAILWLALNVYHEGRCQEQLAQVAIAHVVLNRAQKSNLPIKEVVLKPKQFSWTEKYTYFPDDPGAFKKAMEAAVIAVNGHDFTQGSDHYHKVGAKPYWAKSMNKIGRFGDHVFYVSR
jgi:N-acetylmuramoyl-L-alanine amidase